MEILLIRSLPPNLLFSTIFAGMLIPCCWAQDLALRAYLITPLHSNAINLTYSLYNGGLEFNGVVPITGAMGTYSVPSLSFYPSTVGSISNPATRQTGSRMGGTAAIPLSRHQSIKVSFSTGTYVRIGGDYRSFVGLMAVFVVGQTELKLKERLRD